MIQIGKVLFPKGSCDLLTRQLVNFGVEKHDDLVDAFTILLHMAIKEDIPQAQVLSRELYGAIRGWSRDYGSDSY